MRRVPSTPRRNWQRTLEGHGFSYHSLGGSYWDESAAYELTMAEVTTLEQATSELAAMYVQAAQHAIDSDLLERMGIPFAYAELVKRSWDRDELSLYGRFDLAYSGEGHPKLLEFNADTPTALLEAAVAQWFWLEQVKPGHDQFNSIHEKLIASFQHLRANGVTRMHFACVRESDEDLGTIEYMRDCATQAGLESKQLFVDEIGRSSEDGNFYDLELERITHLFKLYPWEWLIHEDFGRFLLEERVSVYEPAWKLLWSNKAMLPILWRLYPDHPLLLPASYDHEDASAWGGFVRKPFFSREGANVSILLRGQVLEASDGDYGHEGYLFQEYQPLPEWTTADGSKRYPVVGSWLIGGEAAGIGIREGESLITNNRSHFVPHYIRESN